MALRPVMPIVSDLIAHTFFSSHHDHHHHYHGNDHVQFELKKLYQQNDQDQQSSIKWSLEKWNLFSEKILNKVIIKISAISVVPFFSTEAIDDNYSCSIKHPPKIRFNS
jgi:hypothetical protein